MVESRLKVVNKSERKKDLLSAIEKIIKHDFDGLDIIPLENKKWYYRCRVGKIRIIFFVKDWEFYIDKVWYRWDIYK
jgi:mRNA-degrading endonuclease RelE of RelBE toxin-antitoxin system